MNEQKTFLVINPGSTSTKIALFQGTDSCDLQESRRSELVLTPEQLSDCPELNDQLAVRLNQIEEFILQAGNPEIHAIASRGGITRPLEAGSYSLNAALLDDMISHRYAVHPSNLGPLLAEKIAAKRDIPCLMTDPVGVDQFEPAARYSGWPGMKRKSQLHALNMRSVARRAARELGGQMEEYAFIIAHLGGGISVGPMRAGRLIDVNNAMDGGPFSPQRTGTLPLRGIIELAFSGKFTSAGDMIKAFNTRGGLMAYLGTDDAREVIRRIECGDREAEEVYRGMAYQIAKEIGSMASVLRGRVDRILVTGGLARPPLTEWIRDYCDWIAPILLYPGEGELEALAEAAARHLCEGEALKEY
jgi:butyrate kinase